MLNIIADIIGVNSNIVIVVIDVKIKLLWIIYPSSEIIQRKSNLVYIQVLADIGVYE